MRFVNFGKAGNPARPTLGVRRDGRIHVLGHEPLESLLARGVDLHAYAKANAQPEGLDDKDLTFLPLLRHPPKILCIGLNYADHTKESQIDQPDYPTVFLRVGTSLLGHRQPIVRPPQSDSLDYEGELAVVIGKGGRHIGREQALSHVAGYALFNDGSVREYQFKSPQWTVGKNFDSTGAFGPDLVTPDELPAGAKGLHIETRLNGEVVQSANTGDMIFDVPTLIAIISEAMTLEPGDVIVTGTPAGVGWARTPKLLMHAGDVCEVSIEKIGTLINHVVDGPAP